MGWDSVAAVTEAAVGVGAGSDFGGSAFSSWTLAATSVDVGDGVAVGSATTGSTSPIVAVLVGSATVGSDSAVAVTSLRRGVTGAAGASGRSEIDGRASPEAVSFTSVVGATFVSSTIASPVAEPSPQPDNASMQTAVTAKTMPRFFKHVRFFPIVYLFIRSLRVTRGQAANDCVDCTFFGDLQALSAT